MAHLYQHVRRAGRLHDAVGRLQIQGQRLLDEHVSAHFDCFQRHRLMGRGGDRNHDGVARLDQVGQARPIFHTQIGCDRLSVTLHPWEQPRNDADPERQISIRGVGNLIEAQGRQQPSVSYHLNHVPFDPPLTEFYDLQRLEVLRGPQGTLYGRNSTAGAISAITKRPSFAGTQGTLGVELGNYDLLRISGAAETSLSDNFAVRVAGYKLDRDGYIDNLAEGQVREAT